MKRSLLILASLLVLPAPARALEELYTTDKNVNGKVMRNFAAPGSDATRPMRLGDVAVGACVLKSSALNTAPLVCATGGTDFENALTFTSPLVRATNTISITANGIGNTLLRQGAATSVVGNATGSTANVADIACSADNLFVGRTGGTVACQAIPLGALYATSVANVAALEALAGSGYRDGSPVYVQSVAADFVLRTSSSATVDDISVASVSGSAGARWIRQRSPTAWASQTAWSIDPANVSALCSDQGTGADATHPLCSFAELGRRWAGATLTAAAYTVTLMSNAPTSDPMYLFDMSTVQRTTSITVTGTVSVVATGTMSATHNPTNYWDNDHYEFTDAGNSASFNTWISSGYIIHRTSGTSAWAWPYSNRSSNRLQTSVPVGDAGTTATTFAAADAYEVQSLPTFADIFMHNSTRRISVTLKQVKITGASVGPNPVPGSTGPILVLAHSSIVTSGTIGITVAGVGSQMFMSDVMVPATAGGIALSGHVVMSGGLYAGDGSTSIIETTGEIVLLAGSVPITLGGRGMWFFHITAIEKFGAMLYDWTGSVALSANLNSRVYVTALGGERNTGQLLSTDRAAYIAAEAGHVNAAITTHATPFNIDGVNYATIPTSATPSLSSVYPFPSSEWDTGTNTLLKWASVPDGSFVQRSGASIVGVAATGFLGDPGGNGVVVRTAAGTTTSRTLTGGTSITITNGSGVSGNPTFARAALTGDITAPADSNATTLATVNSNVGSFTYGSFTVNGKGLVTAASSGATPALAARTLTAGAGMTGGGDLSADRTFDVVANVDGTIVVNANDVQAGVMQTANIANDAATNAKLANMTAPAFKARITAGAGDPEDITGTQATSMLNTFTSSLKGLVPPGGAAAGTFLRFDGTWAVPPGAGGGGTVTTVTGTAPIVITSTPTTTPNVTVSYDASTITLNGSSQLQVAAQTGDVTKPAGSNTTTIAANAVTFGKWQTLTSDRLVGRDSPGTGNAEEILLSTGLEFSGAQSVRIASTGVSAGSCTHCSLTVNAQGQLTAQSSGATPEVPLTFSTGLTRATNTVTANLSTGVAGGQTATGGTASGNNLTLRSNTSNNGKILLGSTSYGFDEATGEMFLGTATPLAGGSLHVSKSQNATSYNIFSNTGTGGSSAASAIASTSDTLAASFIGLLQYGSNFGTSGLIAANVGELVHAAGSAHMLISQAQASGDIILTTGTGRSERLRIANGGNVGVNQSSPGYKLDVNAGASVAGMHFSSGGADSGGYLISAAADQAIMGAGATFSTPNWVAKATAATLIYGGGGGFTVYANTGLTAGVAYTPTARLTVDGSTGAVAVLSLGTGLVSSSSGTLGNATISSPISFSGGALGLTVPSANRVLAGNTAGTGFVASDEIRLDDGIDTLMIGRDGAIAWRNGAGGSMVAATNYEQVRGFWSANVWTLKSEQGGTGLFRPMTIDASTQVLTLAAAEVRASTLTAGGLVGTAKLGTGELINVTPTAEFNYFIEITTGTIATLNAADQFIATSDNAALYGSTAIEYPLGQTLPTYARLEVCIIGTNTISSGAVDVASTINGSTGATVLLSSGSTGCTRSSATLSGLATDRAGVQLFQHSVLGVRQTASLSGTLRLALKLRLSQISTF
jgi:hypothetical protein